MRVSAFDCFIAALLIAVDHPDVVHPKPEIRNPNLESRDSSLEARGIESRKRRAPDVNILAFDYFFAAPKPQSLNPKPHTRRYGHTRPIRSNISAH